MLTFRASSEEAVYEFCNFHVSDYRNLRSAAVYRHRLACRVCNDSSRRRSVGHFGWALAVSPIGREHRESVDEIGPAGDVEHLRILHKSRPFVRMILGVHEVEDDSWR